MAKWERALFQMAVVSGVFFAWLLAAEAGLLPANSRGDGLLFRWQVWLLTSLSLVATRDVVSQVRCRSCGSREQISPLRLLPLRELLCRNCLGWDAGVPVLESELPADPIEFIAVPDALKPYWSRRPNKAWLPSMWISTVRVYFRRRAEVREERPA